MNRKHTMAFAGVCAGWIASAASASVITGTTYQVDQASSIDISFVSQTAGWTGSLYFSGYELGGIMHRADDSDGYGLGSFVFDNHGTSSGHTVTLGDFDPGSTLHFSYLVYRGDKADGNTRYALQTESSDDLIQFAIKDVDPIGDSARTTLFGVEDIVGSGSDWDYDDIQVYISATTIPSPGATGIICLAAGICASRRRRSV
ncbi:MAG: hypothetical protein ACIAQF_02735 [Phycisphaerales bacterium JB065]